MFELILLYSNRAQFALFFIHSLKWFNASKQVTQRMQWIDLNQNKPTELFTNAKYIICGGRNEDIWVQ